ncbi:MAG: sulfotransferase [Hyphomicrobiales bacterium]|nr:sulfotransferase [Hyphomicrobiales bacterium]
MLDIGRRIGAGPRRRSRKLGFIGVGAQKAGTTTLHNLLGQHPQVEVPRRKELHYFERDHRFDADFRPVAGDYGELHRHFYFDRDIAGEITPLYLYWRPALERIKTYNPKARIIVLLRNPVKRAYSQWGHYIRKSQWRKYRKLKIGPFQKRIKQEIKGMSRDSGYQKVRRSLIGRSLYADQIRRATELFGAEQVLFIKSEDFFADQLGTTDRVCEFLGVAPLSDVTRPEPTHSNVGIVSPIALDDWNAAFEHLRADIDVVEETLGWDCSDWRQAPEASANGHDQAPPGEPVSS